MQSKKARRQLAGAHHWRKDDFASVVDAPAGDRNLLDFGGHDSLEKRIQHTVKYASLHVAPAPASCDVGKKFLEGQKK